MRKIVNIKAEHLGVIKQVPYLIRELKNEIPNTKINIYCDDDGGGLKTKELLIKDLSFEGISLENLKFESSEKIYDYEENENVDLTWEGSYYRYSSLQRLFVDPLKFEKRRLLNSEEISSLKKKYSIHKGRVILGGSLSEEEVYPFIESSKELIKKDKNAQIIIVPRNFNAKVDEIIRKTEIKYRLNKNTSKKENYILITEKGFLDKLYSICDTVVLGDTFKIWGSSGQNPLEPAFYGRRIIAGKNNRLNITAYSGLEESGLMKRIGESHLPEELIKKVTKNEMDIYRERAQKFIDSKQGSAKIYSQIIKEGLEKKLNENRFWELINNIP